MLHRLSLKTILIGGAILAAIIPAALVGIALVSSLRESAIQDATARYELLAKGLAAEYEQFLRSHQRAVLTLAHHAGEHRALAERGVALLNARTRADHPAFGVIAIVGPSGRVLVSDPSTAVDGRSAADIDFSDREWFRELVRSRRPVLDPEVASNRIRQSPTITISAPIRDVDGGLPGAVVAGLELDAIQAIADRIRVGETGSAQTATARGTILAHENREFVRVVPSASPGTLPSRSRRGSCWTRS